MLAHPVDDAPACTVDTSAMVRAALIGLAVILVAGCGNGDGQAPPQIVAPHSPVVVVLNTQPPDSPVIVTLNTQPPASPRCIRIGVGETPSECATPTPTP